MNAPLEKVFTHSIMKAHNTRCFINGWLIDHASGSIIHKDTNEVKRLGEYQLKLLETLAQHAGIVLSRERLTALVWEKRIIGNNSLPNAIHALRAALEDDGKNQKVIKTIPKKGYLLEKEYCEYLEDEVPDEESSDEPFSAEASTDGDTEAAQNNEIPGYTGWQLAPVSENDAESSAKQVKNLPAVANIPPKGVHFSRSYPFYFLIGAVIVAAFVIGVFFFNPDSPQDSLTAMNVTKENEQPYDNISLYRVSKNTQSTRQTAYNIPERLKSSLERINELLEKNNATLDAYYRASDPILHYTFSIKTSCEHKELSMNIFHWRINNDRLNDLVLREIERKLNELSACHS